MWLKVNIPAFKAIRLTNGYTQKELAKRAGVSTSMISQIEHGKRCPGPKAGKKIADFLEVPMEAIFFIQGIDES